MKKVIIIDDRKKRKELHLSRESLCSLEELVKSGMLSIETELEEKSDLASVLGSYDIIAIHRSYLEKEQLFHSLNDYIKISQKHFIVFSGGISQSMILNKGHQLNINSADFYVTKLPVFIKNFCEMGNMPNPLLQFLYGESWKLTLLLQYRHLLWTYKDIDDIDVVKDIDLAEELQDILWDGMSDIEYAEVNAEIELEKKKRINS